MTATRWTVLIALLLLVGNAYPEDAPPLPPGLSSDEAPALPPGLKDDNAPALPPGLAGGDSPDLPEGLAGDATPALPPGLETEPDETISADTNKETRWPFPIHGFWELRGGLRTQDDPEQPEDASIGETRLQLEANKAVHGVKLEFEGDFLLDGVLEEADYDLRRLRLQGSLLSNVDVSVGRQVLTWGTGDMLFINDLFPKDWQSFFIGRDIDYLKAPSDSLRVGWFTDLVNVDFAYTPQFAPDRHITGKRVSYWDPMRQAHSGRDHHLETNRPDTWFEDDEYAIRLYRRIGSYEAAVYGYSGYWKSPAGQQMVPPAATFPKLRVYGASLRGPVGKGLANVEAGYYDSYEDHSGDDPLVNNSEFRLLLGYERELAKEFTASVQYYLEYMMDYGDYRDNLPPIMPVRDRDRHVMTLRLTKMLMNQTLTLSFFGYYSPSDSDAYLRPRIEYDINDAWRLDVGANIFVGESDTTFFGQFEDSTNIYVAVRYAF